MKVALGGIFRNSGPILDRYITQYYSLLAVATDHEIDPIFVEGDSTDNTRSRLNEIFSGHVYERSHGGPTYPSVDNPSRWMQVSYACDGVLEQLKPEHDALLWVEADLIWEPRTLVRLLSHLKTVDMICAMILMRGQFYDSWAFSRDGSFFGGNPPYHPSLAAHPRDQLLEITSGGSCWAIRGDLARKCRFRPPAQAMRGFCAEVKTAGGRIWVDPSLEVYHPVPGVSAGATPQPIRPSRPVVNLPNAPGISAQSRRRVVQVNH